MGNTTCYTGPQYIYGLLPQSYQVHQVSSGGMQGAGNDAYQPPDPLCKTPRAGHGSDSGKREPPPPRCTACDMFIPWAALKHRHPAISLFERVYERKRRRLEEEDDWVGTVTSLWDYEIPLKKVSSFKYLGHPLTETDDNWPEVITILQKVRKIWSFMDIILGREVVDTWTSGIFNVTVVQDTLLFRLNRWVATPHIKRFFWGSTIGWHIRSWGRCLGGGQRGRGSTLIWGMR